MITKASAYKYDGQSWQVFYDNSEQKRINISIQANLLEKIDKFAQEHHLSRSALIQKATFEYIAS